MRKICLTLPTNRACAAMVSALLQEAEYAARTFDVEVHVLILDSSGPDTFAEHARAARAAHATPRIVVHHLDEDAQRSFLREVVHHSGALKPDLLLDLMLPDAVSYGACTNRAFLVAAALGCESVHRRDSDSDYQVLDGEPVFPVHHELMSLGKRAADAVDGVTDTDLDAAHGDKPVSLVGSSFIGELSVDIGEMLHLDRDVYYDVVSLWAPAEWSEDEKRGLVDESFRGAGLDPFARDEAILTLVDPMRVDMCNVSFHRVHEQVPLPPATDTIGSDYFLLHLVYDATLPGVVHNRNIVNFYTGERRTASGFVAYQNRFVKFFLSMLYLNFVYREMTEAGDSLLDEKHEVRVERVAGLVRQSTGLDTAENAERLRVLDRSYRKLGGKYEEFADALLPRRERLLDEARQDMEDFALLIEDWAALIRASRSTSLSRLHA
ncbi:DUF6271 family protein [Streptomyces aureoverticillatus]|uniref:DUF6271 family protein n=1 Tax=Streptomyces aureoverticillatus TaxID=66871 RepID=UPI0013D9F173|nr:DUF6271 family protein [Streptomyces aureoverticillatus]QIB41849.1 hypothetical protein G3H79_00905 [Streptomyces aureoverticillatus]